MLNSMLNKIKTFFKISFVWNRNRSPSSTSKAKSNHGHAISTSGDNSPINFIAKYYDSPEKEPKETIADMEAWDDLFEVFSPKRVHNWAQMIKDPRYKRYGDHNLKGPIKLLKQKFKNIGLDYKDPRAERFNQILVQATTSITELYDNGEESSFKAAMAQYLIDLKDIKDT